MSGDEVPFPNIYKEKQNINFKYRSSKPETMGNMQICLLWKPSRQFGCMDFNYCNTCHDILRKIKNKDTSETVDW